MNPKTEADRLFETWLLSTGHNAYEYEADLGAGAAPDYRVRSHGLSILCEVKGFAPPDPSLGFGYADFRTPIREKINTARKQFRRFRGLPCVLVLANGALIDHPKQMAQVMFGDFEFLVPVRIRPGDEPPPPVEEVPPPKKRPTAPPGGPRNRRHTPGPAAPPPAPPRPVLPRPAPSGGLPR